MASEAAPGEATPASFDVGDRVVLQGLQRASHLNGHHGCVVVALRQGRYGVDVDVDSQRRAIKPINLVREGDDDEDLVVADAVDGILPENHGRAAAYLLDLVREVASSCFSGDGAMDQAAIDRLRQSDEGQKRINHLTSLGWSNWVTEGGDGLELGREVTQGVYEMMKRHFEDFRKDIEEGRIPDREVPQEVYFAMEALESPHAVGGWHVRVHGAFWIVGASEETGGAYLIPDENKCMVYEVLGVRNALYPMIERGPYDRPILASATLIPWYGRLLYDGVILPPGGMPIFQQASPALVERLQSSLQAAIDEGRVISRLRDTQSPFDPSAAPARVVPNREPPTQEERGYMEQLAQLPAPPPFDEFMDRFEDYKHLVWTFRRMGYCEEENPNHMGVLISGGGDMMGLFDCSALVPSSADILRSALSYARERNSQPKVLSIDDRACCDRVKYLLRDTDIRVNYYKPPSKEETDAAMARGGA